jgi:outer membrane protein TolC
MAGEQLAVSLTSILLTICIGATTGCAAGTPRISGASPPESQGVPWQGPAPAIPRAAAGTPATALTRADLQTLTLPQVIDIALRTNPTTRVSWAQARVAAAQYGMARSDLFPSLDGGMTVTRSQSLASSGNGAGGTRTQIGPSVSLSWLALDFGGRSANITAAREIAVAANLSHNAVLQNTVLDVENAIFTYMATRALRDAQETALKEAETALVAAQERHRVGLATIADELQARTARSSVQLRLETLQGQLNISRGGVAVAMGLPANTPVDIPQVAARDSVMILSQSVDSIIALAVRNRPDLAAVQAEALGADADVRAARSAQLPALIFGGNSAYLRNTPGSTGSTYNLSVGIQLPLFNGFRNQYQLRSAQDLATIAAARTQQTQQQVMYEVFAAYYGLQTSMEHVRTAADLLASATESEQVALGRYREGVGTIVDLLVAQTALANARAEDVQAHWQWRAALAQLAHDAGVLGLDGDTTLPPNGVR